MEWWKNFRANNICAQPAMKLFYVPTESERVSKSVYDSIKDHWKTDSSSVRLKGIQHPEVGFCTTAARARAMCEYNNRAYAYMVWSVWASERASKAGRHGKTATTRYDRPRTRESRTRRILPYLPACKIVIISARSLAVQPRPCGNMMLQRRLRRNQ